MAQFYNIPFLFSNILKRVPREEYCCSLQDSLKQHISLIISSRYKEFRYDSSFGCKVWELDFIVPANLNIWKEEIKQALEESILKYEHRVEKIEIKIDISKSPADLKRINQVLDFRVTGSFKGISETFDFSDRLYFSPYSL